MAEDQSYQRPTDHIFHFGLYRLDLPNQQLSRGKQAVRLTGKAFAVLSHLVSHSGQLVSKDDIFQAVWPDTVVGDSTLTSCVKELRKALHDKAKAPQYIETVHRRGFRFIAALTTPQPDPSPESQSPQGLQGLQGLSNQPVSAPPLPLLPSALPVVGREAELEQLHEWLDKTLAGERHIVFVTGEPGIGKTAVVETFVSQIAAQEKRGRGEHLEIGHGQCIEQYGAGEAYLPILEALGRLCRGPQADQLIALLRQHAPTWLAQMPVLLPPEEREQLQREVQGVTRERMLRELAEALEVLTAESPLILVLEDLHWSDASTISLLAALARRQEVARLLVLGTYRPVEMLANGHPLRGLVQELSGQRLCTELPLRTLTVETVEAYLARRFPNSAFPTRLPQVLYDRTGGNPLFLVNTVEDLIAGNLLAETEGSWCLQTPLDDLPLNIPESLRRLIAKQMERLESPERQILAAGSIAGTEFSAAAVAAALETDVVEVEACSEALAMRQAFLQRAGVGEWPDRTQAARYGFQHALHQELWYEQVSVSQRQQWQLRIGERLEEAYGDRTQEIAAELAIRFEQAGDAERAIPYLQQAGENALQQNGYNEAITHLTKGLSVLKALPEAPERPEQELGLQILLAPALLIAKGCTAVDVGTAYHRVRELCQQTGEVPRVFPALVGLFLFYGLRAEYQTTRDLAEQMLQLGERSDDPVLQMWAHMAMGTTLAMMGEFVSAREHQEYAISLYTAQRSDQTNVVPLGMGSHSLRLIGAEGQALGMTVFTLYNLGYPAQAVQNMKLAIAFAQGQSHPFSLVTVLSAAAHLHLVLRQVEVGHAHTEACLSLGAEYGFQDLHRRFVFYRGWTLALQGQMEEGLGQMRESIASLRAAGQIWMVSDFLAFLADIYLGLGRCKEGLDAITEAFALMEETGERHYEAEIYRLKGELVLRDERQTGIAQDARPATEAESYFQHALEISRRQEAKALELRAAMSMSRLWQQQGRQQQAHQLLSKVYAWFTEGFDTADLQDAKALLAELV